MPSGAVVCAAVTQVCHFMIFPLCENQPLPERSLGTAWPEAGPPQGGAPAPGPLGRGEQPGLWVSVLLVPNNKKNQQNTDVGAQTTPVSMWRVGWLRQRIRSGWHRAWRWGPARRAGYAASPPSNNKPACAQPLSYMPRSTSLELID